MATELSTDELTIRLRATADGIYAAEASVELVVRSFLLTKLRRFITLEDDLDSYAAIDWAAAADALADGSLGMSRGERRLMDVAASLGAGYDTNLTDLAAMDEVNATLVLEAIVHSLGWHTRGRPAVITGSFTA
jgi:hypothetical protein